MEGIKVMLAVQEISDQSRKKNHQLLGSLEELAQRHPTGDLMMTTPGIRGGHLADLDQDLDQHTVRMVLVTEIIILVNRVIHIVTTEIPNA